MVVIDGISKGINKRYNVGFFVVILAQERRMIVWMGKSISREMEREMTSDQKRIEYQGSAMHQPRHMHKHTLSLHRIPFQLVIDPLISQ